MNDKRKSYLYLPLLTVPFIISMFSSMDGGKGDAPVPANTINGFNPHLPGARFDKQPKEENKMDSYNKADLDSARRKENQQKDPYLQSTDTTHKITPSATLPVSPTGASPLPEDARADELLKKLDHLKQALPSSPRSASSLTPYPSAYPPTNPSTPASSPLSPNAEISPYPSVSPYPTISPLTPPAPIHSNSSSRRSRTPHLADSEENDPQLEKLNGMLDKIIRIQHPGQSGQAAEAGSILDTTTNSLPALVAEDQVLVAGSTIALRLTSRAAVNGITFPKDQLVYGVVSISNDRMLIHISSIRSKEAIYSTALQVYDLDGLPGIHIPGSLGRETAKESADQSINAMNIASYDPTLGAQAANAGIQAARTLLSKKVRLVRVTVHSGYQVLLRNTNPHGSIRIIRPDHTLPDSSAVLPNPKDFDLRPFLHHSTTSEKMELVLQGIWLDNTRIFFSLQLSNHSHLSFIPEYIRWFIHSRRQQKRTALQEIPLDPVYNPPLSTLPGDSSVRFLAAFPGFTLPKDKELVLQLADKGGARFLTLTIDHKEILKAQLCQQQKDKKASVIKCSPSVFPGMNTKR